MYTPVRKINKDYYCCSLKDFEQQMGSSGCRQIEKLVSPLTKSKPLSVLHKRDIADSRLELKAQLGETQTPCAPRCPMLLPQYGLKLVFIIAPIMFSLIAYAAA